MLVFFALPFCPDIYDRPLHAPALTPTMNGNVIPCSMKQSSTPQVKTPRSPPPSSTNAVFFVSIFAISSI